MAATKRGYEFAQTAERCLREGKVEEAKSWHKHAWNAFKEARDGLLEGDTNTKMALKILIDYHREREKNPGDPRQAKLSTTSSIARGGQRSAEASQNEPEQKPSAPEKASLAEAKAAVQDFEELMQGAQNAGPPPSIPEPIPVARSSSSSSDWRRGQQSIMAESFLLVGGESLHGHTGMTLPQNTRSSTNQPLAHERSQSQSKSSAAAEIDALLKENQQLRKMLQKEREENKTIRERFWHMFAVVKSSLEGSNHESDLKALTRVLHAETEARKKAEAELDNLRRNFA